MPNENERKDQMLPGSQQQPGSTGGWNRGDEGRPMLARSDVAEVFTARQTSYSSAATLTIDTGGRSPEDITADILTRLAGD